MKPGINFEKYKTQHEQTCLMSAMLDSHVAASNRVEIFTLR